MCSRRTGRARTTAGTGRGAERVQSLQGWLHLPGGRANLADAPRARRRAVCRGARAVAQRGAPPRAPGHAAARAGLGRGRGAIWAGRLVRRRGGRAVPPQGHARPRGRGGARAARGRGRARADAARPPRPVRDQPRGRDRARPPDPGRGRGPFFRRAPLRAGGVHDGARRTGAHQAHARARAQPAAPRARGAGRGSARRARRRHLLPPAAARCGAAAARLPSGVELRGRGRGQPGARGPRANQGARGGRAREHQELRAAHVRAGEQRRYRLYYARAEAVEVEA